MSESLPRVPLCLPRTTWILIQIGLVGGITTLHYSTGQNTPTEHVVFAKLYYIPVILAALRFGVRGAIWTLAAIVLLYGPHLFTGRAFSTAMRTGFLLDLLVMCAVGWIGGRTMDRERAHQARANEAERLAGLGTAASMMAHEIKTPLIAIGGFARAMLRQPRDRQDRERLEIVAYEVSRLERLVRDGLDLARHQAIDIARCEVGPIVERARSAVEPTASEKGVGLVVELDERASTIGCDCERIQQVLINLLDNAIAHTPCGEEVILRSSAYRSGIIRFEVLDAGDGVPEEMRDRLFEPFARGRKDGSGLGLAIASRIVASHTGRLGVTDRPEGGTVFWFELPCDRLDKPEGEQRPDVSASVAG